MWVPTWTVLPTGHVILKISLVSLNSETGMLCAYPFIHSLVAPGLAVAVFSSCGAQAGSFMVWAL